MAVSCLRITVCSPPREATEAAQLLASKCLKKSSSFIGTIPSILAAVESEGDDSAWLIGLAGVAKG